MRKYVPFIVSLVMLIGTSVYAGNVVDPGFDFIIDSGYDSAFALENSESLKMTGGGIGVLSLFSSSYAEILGSSPFQIGVGGIERLSAFDSSSFLVAGGHVHEIIATANATGTLAGGIIDRIRTTQVVPDPHIEMFVRDYDFNVSTNILTGTWEDFSTFSIFLDNQGVPYDPVIENIKFTIVPEPMTLSVMGLGGFLVRRRRRT